VCQPLDVVVGRADEGEEIFDRMLAEHPNSAIPLAEVVEDRVRGRPRLVQVGQVDLGVNVVTL
jgi:hypothetical protein